MKIKRKTIERTIKPIDNEDKNENNRTYYEIDNCIYSAEEGTIRNL